MASPSSNPEPTRAPEAALRLLLVDWDDARTSRRLAEMLREDGFEVEIVRDGAHAIARFTRSPFPDVLVTELTLGDAAFAAVCRFTRAQRPGLPIFVVTSRPNSIRPEELGEPQPLVFTKPMDYVDLHRQLLITARTTKV